MEEKQLTQIENQVGFKQFKILNDWAKTSICDSQVTLEISKIIVNHFTNNTNWCYNCFKSSRRKHLYFCKYCKQAKYCSWKCYKNHQIKSIILLFV